MTVQKHHALHAVPPESEGCSGDAGKSRADLDFWIGCIGVPVVVVEKQTLAVHSINRSALAFFGIAASDGCSVQRLVGTDAARMLEQIWSKAPIGVAGDPFILLGQVQGQERLLMVQVSQLVVEHEPVRLLTFTDAPPKGSIDMVGWQENIIAMLDWLPFGFEIASTDDQVQFVNSKFHELFGYSPHELEDIGNWWELAYPDPEYRRYAQTQWETSTEQARAENREMTPFDLQVVVKGGEQRTIQFRHRTIGNFNVNLYLDVTRERAYARELKTLADTDPLTGTLNRRRFFKQAERSFAAARPSPTAQIAILMLDIDNFKRINDVHGHGAGDLVLVEFTRRCSRAIRKNDLLARLGGEEFSVLLDDVTQDEVAEIGERVLTEINGQPFAVNGLSLDVTVSIGAALRRTGEELDTTLYHADRALYVAKKAGRNRLVFDGSALDDVKR